MYNNKYKIIVILFVITLIFSVFTVFVYSEGTLSVSARGAALYEPETNTFLYSKNSNARLAMASTTKIMTAFIALEKLDPEEYIIVDERAVGVEGSSIYLKAGEALKAIDLVYATLLQSANDAAEALAYRISGSIEEFSCIMNEKARSLGLEDTKFENPHGLDAKNHYTSAHDLAIIASTALKNESFKTICSTYKKEIISSEMTRVLVNHNKMLKRYDGCIGIKTGYTKKSGRSLVSAAERDGLTLISVTINAPDDWNDHKKMLDYGYGKLEAVMLAKSGEFSYQIPVIDGVKDYINISNKKSEKMIFYKGDSDFEAQVKLSRYVSAPVSQGAVLGKVLFIKSGKIISSLDLTADTGIDSKKTKNFFHSIK